MKRSYDFNAIKNSYRSATNSGKSEAQKFLEKQGVEFNENGNVVVDLIIQTNNGNKNLGKVSYSAYNAIEKNTLDSYKPKNNEEKSILDKYRLQTGAELTKDDGTSLGFVSQAGLKAISEDNIKNYTPINADEKKAIDSYVAYATQKRKQKLDEYKATAQKKVADIEKEKSKVVEDTATLRREKAAAKRSSGLSTSGTKWETKDTRTAKEKREGKPMPKSEGETELKKLENEYRNLDKEADAMVDTISNIDKYANVKYNDKGIVGQTQANYTQGRLSQDTAQAYSNYIGSPTEANKMRAEAMSALSEQFQINNKDAFTSEDEDVNKAWEVVRDWVGVSLATYIPQFIDQTKASIKGAVGGAVGGAVVGSALPGVGTAVGAIKGGKMGWVAGASQQMYQTTRGMVYKTLIDAGYDEETAIAAAKDEAFVSSIIEGCGEIVSMATLGTGKLVGKLAPKAATKVSNNIIVKGIKEFAEKTGKTISENVFLKTATSVAGVVLNAAGEYVEEYSQEAVSIANERRLKNPNASGKLNLASETISLLNNMDDETKARLEAAGTEGFRIGLMMGGGTVIGNKAGTSAIGHISNAITGGKIKKADANTSGLVQSVIDIGLQQSENSKANKLATKLSESDKISSPKLGKLSKAIKGDTVNVGETYYDTKSKGFVNIVSRDDTTTTVTLVNSDGIGIAKEFSNEAADNIVKNNRYVMVANDAQTEVEQTTPTTETTETPTVEETSPVEETTVVAENIPADDGFDDYESEADELLATDMSEDETVVTEQETPAETVVAENETTPDKVVAPQNVTPKNITLTQVGNSYNVYGEDANIIGEHLGLDTTKKVINGVETDVITFPTNFLDGLVEELGGEYNFITNTQTTTTVKNSATDEVAVAENTTTTETENEVVTEENATNDETVSNNNVELAEGEILSLKRTKNIYSLFKGAETIYVGKDIITDRFVAIPLTDKNLEGVKKVAKDAKIENKPDFSLDRIYNKDNDVVIQGEPKVSVGVIPAYVFKINGKFYIAQQKYIDAFNNGKNIIKANSKNYNTAWTVHDENGNLLVAIMLPMKNNDMTEEIYDGLKSVSEVKQEVAQQKANKAAEKAEAERQNAEYEEQAKQKNQTELERRKGLSTPEELNTLKEKYVGKEFTDGERTYRVEYLEDKAWFEFAEVKEDGTLEHFGARLVEPSVDAMEQHISLLEKLKQNNEKNKEIEKTETEKKAKEQAIKDEEEKYLNAYISGMKPMMAAKIKNTLSKDFNKFIKLHKFVENAVKNGQRLEAKDVNGKMSYRLYKDDNLYFEINKTAYDYGKYLENSRNNDDNLPFPYEENTVVEKTPQTVKADTTETKPDIDTKDAEKVLKNQSESDTIQEKETPVENGIDKEPDNATSKSKGTKQIADYVAKKLANGEKISAMELSKVATESFGGTMANNVFTVKDAYDAMELGVNQHILSMKEVSAEKMLELLELLPTQTKRTEEMDKFQQFSTPPSIAYLANYTANVNENDVMLEPSAGIGGIAVFAKKDGAKVYVNELDNRRLEVLKNLPFDGFYNEDAEQINNILGGEIEPTVIVMNPPFSSSSERNMKNTKIGAKHIEQALKILAPNGRLVAIVGKGMADGEPAFRTWWKDIKSQYNVRANIGINGKNYNKYGTNFDIQMLVIDKNGTTTETVTGYVDTLQDLQEKLGGIRDERPAIDYSGNEQRTPTTTRTDATPKGKTTDNGNGVVSDTSGVDDKGKPKDKKRITEQSTDQNVQSTDAEHGKPSGTTTENTDVVVDEDKRVGSRESDGLDGEENTIGTDNNDSGQSDIQTGRVEPRKRVKRKELTDSIFEQYQTQPLKLKNTQPHPAKVSESAAMSAIEPPPITYTPNLPKNIVEKGVVSDVQLEAISYAGQSHSQTLPNGTTRGFFLGDGTGIGKGRTIAGMMLDNYNQGRKKAVWVTLNSSLVNDAKRDVKALFGDSDLVTQFVGGNKADSVLNTDEAIMVISYSALAKGFDNKDSNYEKIVKWLGKDFDGLIVFDEAHKMGNATATKGTRGMKKASQTGIAGIALQEALPKAKVVYSSATGATEVENLRYAERLGLWGDGTSFINGDDFVSKIKAGGLAAMELIARDMKAMGVYLSRNISYDDVQYDKITHNLTAPQTKIYDELAKSWQIVLQNINKALESTNQDKDGHARGRALGAFWSSQQRFFNQILTSMQVPSVISDIEKQLADGKSCVIQLVSTNESAQNQEFERLKSEELELDEFDLTPKQVLMSLIENSFPVQQFEKYRDDNGNVRSRPVYDSKGKPVINREAVEQRDELLSKLGSIKVPSSPIDMIINHFGTDLVAENTGRARRVIQKDGKTIEEKIGNKKDADVDAFQNGNKRIIIFSKAGGTGKSYHADKAAKNQQQRVHYLLEAGWQADNAVQGFGRSHRSNQVSAPIFKLVTTNLKGQMRFISTIAKRLDQLGAMTKGQRQAGSQGMFSASDNLENSFAADVLAGFYKDLISNKVEGIDDGMSILEKLGLKSKILDEYNRIIPTAPELREVNKFLNRILSLESSEQNTVFEGYSQRLQEATENAMQAGTLDKGLENYKADKITLNEYQDIREDERSGAKTKYYNLTAEHKIKVIKFADIPTTNKSFVGFYQNQHTGAIRAVFQTSSITDKDGNVINNYKLMGQTKNEYVPQNRFYGNWTELNNVDVEELWNEEVSKLPEYRQENLHLISGAVLPVWDKLPTENVRIYRVLTSDGEMLIGRVIPENMIDQTLKRLGSSRKKEKVATKDLINGIKNGDTVTLDNGWKIVQRKVSGENRIEVVGPAYEHHDLLKNKGVFTERIQYFTRYFIPADTNTEKTLDEILKISPVSIVESAKYSVESEELNNEQTGDLLSDGSDKWAYSSSSKRKTKRLDGRTSRYRESKKTARERRKYCQTLKTSGLTEQKIINGHKCEVIPTEHYEPRMTKITERNKKNGIDETIFVTGAVEIPFLKDKNGNPKTSKGVYIKWNGKKTVIVQYDNDSYLPEQINDHEIVHDKYYTPLVQKVRNIVINSMSVVEKRQVLEKLSRDYNGIIEGNEEDIIQEFVANVLSDMDYNYIGEFAELQKAYWKGDEQFIDNFKVSEYTESIDTGGNDDVLENIGFGSENTLFMWREPTDVFPPFDEYPYSNTGSYAMIWANNSKIKNLTRKIVFYQDVPYLIQKDNSIPEGYKIIREVEAEEVAKIKKYKKYTGGKNGNYTRGKETVRFDNEVGTFVKFGRGNDSDHYSVDKHSEKTIETGRVGELDNQGGNYSDRRVRTSEYGDGDKSSIVKYSFDTVETDTETLTPERKKEILEQYERDRVGVEKPTQKQLWGERAEWIAHNMSRVFPNIPERGERGTFFAEFRKNMIQWNGLSSTADFMVKDKLNEMTKGLTPAEFKTFGELVYFLDLQEEAQIQKDRGYDEILLPNEITPDEVDAIVEMINEEATENVKKALDNRQKIWNDLKEQYIALNQHIGFNTDEKFKRKNYYHHQVIEYMNGESKGTGSRAINIKAGRGWLKERQGSTKAINTDFLAVEHKAMLQMQYDIYVAQMLGKIKDKYDIKPQLEKQAFNNNKKQLNDIIKKEATDDEGNIMFDSKGKPDSETYREQQAYNRSIMRGFNGLFELAEADMLPTFNGQYGNAIRALKKHNLNAPGLYNYVAQLASMELNDNATDEEHQAQISARTVLKYTSQKKAWVKQVLGNNYQTWETIAKSMSDTHTIHQPRRGNYFYTKEVLNEDAFNQAFNDMIVGLVAGENGIDTTSDVKKLFEQYSETVRQIGAAYEQWVIPNEIVTTMQEVANPKALNEGQKVARAIMTTWKGAATSTGVLRTVKFGLRNMAGDLDAVIAGNPKILMYSKRAVEEIYQAMRHKKYTDDFIEFVERGGYSSMLWANEMDTEMQEKFFSHLMEKTALKGKNILEIPANIQKKYKNGVETAHNFREAILRYSAYLYYKEAIKRNSGNVKDYVASNRYIVKGLESVEDKAYQLAKDLLGAYDEVGKMGQTLRRYWIPFYSFTETNLKRYYRLFENIIMSDDSIPKKAGKLLLKTLMVNLFGLLLIAWNRLAKKDDDDKLPTSARNVPHLTLGTIGGNVYSFRQLGSFSEILEWFGLEDYKWESADEPFKEMVNKAYGMINPGFKYLYELPSGMNSYPDVFKPSPIRDRWEYLANSWGVAEFYNLLSGKPTKGIGEIVKGAFIYSYDINESAYNEIRTLKYAYQGKDDGTTYKPNKKSNALYYMKKAVKYKDKETALKYLDEYFENGGTAKGITQSFSTLNPMYGFTGKDTIQKGEAFIATLTPEEKEKLKMAQDYYEKELMLPENVSKLLGKKDMTEERAKNLLKEYINSQCK